jgi:hypothetical protein
MIEQIILVSIVYGLVIYGIIDSYIIKQRRQNVELNSIYVANRTTL